MIRLTPGHPLYPPKLRAIDKPPSELWLWGTLPDPDAKTVGVVGTRRVTPLGMRIARVVAVSLARAGAVVVSGLAQGVDSVAHGGALDAGGRTIAVLGEGLAYMDDHGPIRRRQLARRIREGGALVSEYPLDMRASGWTFPKRNRTIAGLSDVLVVIEAPEGSGSLITANEMRAIGRPVYVVAGPIDSSNWAGSNTYIQKRHGRMLANVQQVAKYLGLTLQDGSNGTQDGSDRGRLAGVLAGEPAAADAIAAALGIDSADAATVIAEELVAGRIVPTGDGRFALP